MYNAVGKDGRRIGRRERTSSDERKSEKKNRYHRTTHPRNANKKKSPSICTASLEPRLKPSPCYVTKKRKKKVPEMKDSSM